MDRCPRALQGVGAAIMFPAALAIVVQTFPLNHRGRALALFFGIAGALTAIAPIAGGYLTEWTWQAIFWVNVPVAALALLFIAITRPTSTYRRAPMDFRGSGADRRWYWHQRVRVPASRRLGLG